MVATNTNVFFCIVSSLVFLVFTLIFRTLIKGTTNSNTKIRPPPSPPSLPIIGHLHLLGSVIPKSLQSLARKYGPLTQLHLGASTCIVVSNAQVAKEILKTHELNFCNRNEFGSSEHNPYKGSSFVTAPYGPYWRFMKKLCMTQLLSSSQLGRFSHIREQEIHKLLKSLIVCSSEGRACDLTLELTALTNNNLCRMAMSTSCLDNANDAEEIHGIVKELMDVTAKLIIGDVLGPLGKFDLFGYGKKLSQAVWKIDKVLERILEEHEKKIGEASGEEPWDMIDIMLQAYRDPNAEVRFTRNDMKGFILEIFLAGTETTSANAQWIMAEILNHPTVLKKLKAEIEVVVGTKRLVNESDIPNMPYLQAVVKEGLRLHPTVPIFFRQAAEDCIINGYNVKSEIRILINVYAIMRDPEVWDNQEEFAPERFLEVSKKDGMNDEIRQHLMKMNMDDFRYIPFGFGRRGCPGSSLALIMIHVIIATLIQCFEWKIKEGDKVDTEEGSSLSAGLANPLVCYPTTCFNPF